MSTLMFFFIITMIIGYIIIKKGDVIFGFLLKDERDSKEKTPLLVFSKKDKFQTGV